MSSFDFLNKNWPALANKVQLAERYVFTDANAGIFKLGAFAEQLVNYVFEESCLIEGAFEETFANKIYEIFRVGIIDKNINDILYSLRVARNYAVHSDYNDTDRCFALLSIAHKLAIWFVNIYGEGCPIEDYVIPNKPDETESIIKQYTEKIEALELKLSNVTYSNKSPEEYREKAAAVVRQIKLNSSDKEIIKGIKKNAKYKCIFDFLYKSGEDIVIIDLDELERFGGIKFPMWSKKYSSNFWSNTYTRPHAHNWLIAGYDVVKVDDINNTVKFARRNKNCMGKIDVIEIEIEKNDSTDKKQVGLCKKRLPNTADFRRDVLQRINEMQGDYIDITSGDVHYSLGGGHGNDYRGAPCCNAMRSVMENGDIVLPGGPPSGQGSTLVIRYYKR